VLPTPDEYRANAAECLRMRQLSTIEEIKAALLLMAQSWHQLAEHAEAIRQATPPDA